MAQKIFVSYKYADEDVARLPRDHWARTGTTNVRDYVDEFMERTSRGNTVVYKGERDGEDLSLLSEETIWSLLKDKIYDSTLTIVFISPNMRTDWEPDREQWIPWEISFSLRKQTRNNRTSQMNALLFVELPDRNGEYGYRGYMTDFKIVKENIENGYAIVVRWHEFINNIERYITMANQNRNNIPEYNISKTV